jgi:hypothetical protein
MNGDLVGNITTGVSVMDVLCEWFDRSGWKGVSVAVSDNPGAEPGTEVRLDDPDCCPQAAKAVTRRTRKNLGILFLPERIPRLFSIQ